MNRARLHQILTLALPIMGGMASQTALNLIDTAMVGRLGDSAIAAVGIGSFTNFLCQAFILGISVGVQAMSSRRKGENLEHAMAIPLNGGLLMVLVLAIPLATSLIFATPHFFPALNSDPAVQSLGIPYLQVRLLGMVAVGMNFAFRGYWNGVSLPKLYLRTLLLMHSVNVVLSYTLIFGKLGLPRLGATGAGIGTTCSLYVGTAYYFFLGWRHARKSGFLQALPDLASVRTMIRLSTPNGVQQVFFAGGFVTLFWIIGQVGTREVAAANVLINIMMFAILPGLGLGLAAASLVGQALGRDDIPGASQWGWDVAKVAAALMTVLGLPMVVVPHTLLSIFLDDPLTVCVARPALQLVGLGMAIDGVGLVLMNALLGAGATRIVLAISVSLQWGLFLPVAWWVGPNLGLGLLGIWIAQIGYRLLLALVYFAVWKRGKWAQIPL